MYIHRLIFLFIVFVTFHLLSCQKETQQRQLVDQQQIGKVLELSNKRLLAQEEQAIDDFLVRYGWEMDETGSGLRYKIDEEGNGPKAAYGQIVELTYDVYLLNGDHVYSSEEDGVLQFKVGRGAEVTGLDEGVRLLNQGAKATFIIPFHLAHGIPGDGNRIPGRKTIIYHVEITTIF